jgi:hypothetical protein
MTKTLEARIQAAFDHDTYESFGRQYLDIVIVNLREAVQGVRKAFTLLAILIIAFLLLAHAKTAEVTLGPQKLTNVAAVLTLVPVFVAALGYEWATLVGAADTYRKAVGEVVRITHPAVFENDLELFITPPAVNYSSVELAGWKDVRVSEDGVLAGIMNVAEGLVLIAVLLGYLAFFVYAYKYLYADARANSFAVSTGLCVAAVFVVRAVVSFIALFVRE